jgi:hypothetical protein
MLIRKIILVCAALLMINLRAADYKMIDLMDQAQDAINQAPGDAELWSIRERLDALPEPNEAELGSLRERINSLLELRQAQLRDLMERIDDLPTGSFKISADPKRRK